MNKNTYIAIIVLILLIVGVWLIVSSNNNNEVNNITVTTEEAGQTANTQGETEGNTSQTPSPSGGVSAGAEVNLAPVKEFTVTAKNFSYTPNSITVNKGDKVKITFKNTAGFHDFKIDEYGVAAPQAQAPQEQVLEFTATKAGTFEYYCSVGTHRAQGMVGTLVVK